jgi:glycosyltransferase involved in cell wall biosynthesis
MRILIVSHYFPPEGGPASARIQGLARNLVRLGHMVTVLTGFPNYPQGHLVKPYKVRLIQKECLDGISVIRSFMAVLRSRGPVSRLLNYLSFTLSAIAAGVLSRERFDVVIASSPPLFLGFSGYVISRAKGCPLVFDVRDIWPDIAVAVGEVEPGSTIYRLLRWLEDFTYRKSDLITVVTQEKARILIKKGVEEAKIRVVSNGIDDEFLDTPIDRDLRRRLGLEGCFLVLYAGLLGKAQGMDDVLEAAAILQNRAAAVRFVIVGDGVEKQRLTTKADGLTLRNVLFLPYISKSEVRSYLSMADLLVVPLKNSDLRDSVPSKLYECMSVGVPVLLSADGESRDVLALADAGVAVSPGEPAAMGQIVLDLAGDPELRRRLGANGLNYVLRNCLRSKVAVDLQKALEQVVR